MCRRRPPFNSLFRNKAQKANGKSTQVFGNQVPQASNGKEGELSYGDEVSNDETTSVSIGCAAKVTIAWPTEVIVTQPAEVTVTQPMEITGTQPTDITGTQPMEWSCLFRISFRISLTWLSTRSLWKSLQQLPSISESQHGRITKICLIHVSGRPLLTWDKLKKVTAGIKRLHDWYMRAPVVGIDTINVYIPPTTFVSGHQTAVVTFEDMWLMMNLQRINIGVCIVGVTHTNTYMCCY